VTLAAQAAKNVGAIWLNLLVHGIVGFFLSPLILHRLGDELFSLWVLIFSLTGYCGLLDLGIRAAVVRYTAKFAQLEDRSELAKLISTALGFYGGMALLSLLLTGIGYFYLPVLFKVPAADLNAARVLLLMAGTGVALSFPLNLFAAIIEAMQRFTYLGFGQIVVTLLRALAIVIALASGGKLLAIGGITVGVNLLSSVLFTGIALKILPIRLSISRIDRRSFHKMIAYGALAFLIPLADKLRFQSDAMVIGAFLSAPAITSFSVAAKLVEYSGYAIRGVAQIFTPLSSQMHAAGDYASLRRILVTGNFASALISFPLCVILLVLGKSILEVWVGPKYVPSYPILVLLAIPRSLYVAQSASIKLLMGMGEHGRLAYVLLTEGIVNVALSIFLVRRAGLFGVALGTTIPLAVTSLFFLPLHVSGKLQMPIRRYLRQTYLVPALLCLPLALALWAAERQYPAHSLRGLMVKLAFGAVIYGAGTGSVMLSRARSSGSWKKWVQTLRSEMRAF